MPIVWHVLLLATQPMLSVDLVLAGHRHTQPHTYTRENKMRWFGTGAERRVFQMILASLMVLGVSASARGQGLGDDFAQEWIELEDDAKAIELAGCFSSKSSSCDECDLGCDSGCDSCCPTEYCPPWWAHRTGLSAEFLFLRPGNTDLIYSIEQNNLPPNAFPTGPVGQTAIEHSPGVRARFTHAKTECTSLVGSVTYWEGDASNQIDATGANILASQILHPSRLNTGASGLQESARYDMRFGLADLAFRQLWKRTDTTAINWRAGLQYGGMEQEYDWAQTVPSSVAVGTFDVTTDIDYNGFGLLAGIDFERYCCRTGLSIYGNAIGSALAGKWKATYADSAQLAGGVVANQYDDYRVTPTLNLELGFAWQSKCGRCRVNTGYMTSAWYNAVSSRSYIDAVRQGRYIDVDETITFSGLVVGGEYRF